MHNLYDQSLEAKTSDLVTRGQHNGLKWILGAGVVLAWMLVGSGVVGATSVTLEQAVHFLTPGGDDVVIQAGDYDVEQAETWLRLVPGERQDAVLIQAEATTHNEALTDPVALSVAGDEADRHHVLLLLPDGTGVEAIGSYSGVRSRASFLTRLSQARRRQAVSQAVPVSPLNRISQQVQQRVAQQNAQAALEAVKQEGKNFYACLRSSTKGRPPICVTIGELSIASPQNALAIAQAVRAAALRGAGTLATPVTKDYFLSIFPGSSWSIGCGGEGPYRGHGYLKSNKPSTAPGMGAAPQLNNFTSQANQGFRSPCTTQPTQKPSNTITELLGQIAAADSDITDFLATYSAQNLQCQNESPFSRFGSLGGAKNIGGKQGGIISRGIVTDIINSRSVKQAVGKIWSKIPSGEKTPPKTDNAVTGVRGDCQQGDPCSQSCEVKAAVKGIIGLMKKYDFSGCNANVRENPDAPRTCNNVETGKTKITPEVLRQLRVEFCKKQSQIMGSGSSLCEVMRGREAPNLQRTSICQDPRAMCVDDQTGFHIPNKRTGLKGGPIGPIPIAGPIPGNELPFMGNVPFP